MARRPTRTALAACAAAAAGAVALGGCGAAATDPAFQAGYHAGTAAYAQILATDAPAGKDRLTWLCDTAAYRKVQSMANDYAVSWQDGWNRGCQGRQP